MRKFAKLAVIAAAAVVAGTAAAQERVQSGQLTCDISGGIGLIFGSQRTLNCTFAPSVPGPVEFYAGTLTKLGVDIGVTVFMPRPRGRPVRFREAMAALPPRPPWWRASERMYLSAVPIVPSNCNRFRCKAKPV